MNEISLVSVYFTLLLAAFILIGAEIYVPGGILGSFGAACLVAAVIVGFRMGPVAGWSGMGLVLVLAVAGAFFWMTVFPGSPAGRRLTLKPDRQASPPGDSERGNRIGQTGIALSPLRPAGVAQIDGHRVDVQAEDGRWLDAGTRLRVSRISSSQLYVEELPTPPKDPPS